LLYALLKLAQVLGPTFGELRYTPRTRVGSRI